MTLTEQYTLASNEIFIGRVLMAAVTAAIEIGGEECGGTDEPTVDQHLLRSAWAQRVLQDPLGEAYNLAMGVAANPAITTESTDSDIQFTVNSLINDYAGVE